VLDHEYVEELLSSFSPEPSQQVQKRKVKKAKRAKVKAEKKNQVMKEVNNLLSKHIV